MIRILPLLLVLLIIATPVASQSDTIVSKIWDLYPDYSDFDTKVYVEEIDTCFSLVDLSEENRINWESIPSIVIESIGRKPLRIDIDSLLSGRKNNIPTSYVYEKGEISRRRVPFLVNPPNYKCLDYDKVELDIDNRIQGLFQDAVNRSLLIIDSILLLIENIDEGFLIKAGKYSIVNDRISSTELDSYVYNQSQDKIMRKEKDQASGFIIEACILLNDCIHNHLTTLAAMWFWKRKESTQEFDQILRQIKDYR